MSLTPTDVERIAHLARLELSPAERDTMLGQLNGFFSIVEALRQDMVVRLDAALAGPVAA